MQTDLNDLPVYDFDLPRLIEMCMVSERFEQAGLKVMPLKSVQQDYFDGNSMPWTNILVALGYVSMLTCHVIGNFIGHCCLNTCSYLSLSDVIRQVALFVACSIFSVISTPMHFEKNFIAFIITKFPSVHVSCHVSFSQGFFSDYDIDKPWFDCSLKKP